MKIKVDDEFADKVTAASLKDAYKYLGKSHNVPVFSMDELEEKALVKEYRRVFALAHNWFTEPSKHIEIKD